MSEKTRIYVGGTFDCFHAGHARLLRRAKSIADFVVVALNSDAFAESYKKTPIMGESERLEILRACRYVDLVFLMESHGDQRRNIEVIRPNYILHGDDWSGASLVRQLGIDQSFLDQHGILMRYVPYTAGVSTTDIKDRVLRMAEERPPG